MAGKLFKANGTCTGRASAGGCLSVGRTHWLSVPLVWHKGGGGDKEECTGKAGGTGKNVLR